MLMKFLPGKTLSHLCCHTVLAGSADKNVNICKKSFPWASLLCLYIRTSVPNLPEPAQVPPLQTAPNTDLPGETCQDEALHLKCF